MIGRRLVTLALCLGLFLCAFTPAAAAAAQAPAPPAFNDEELAYIAGHGPLRVGFVQDRIPVSFSDENGELQGISRYIFDHLAEVSGLTFEYVPLPAGAITYDYLREQRLDLVTSVEYNRENLNARGILISQPYLTSRKVVVARSDLEFSYSAPHTVAISSGSQTIRKVLGAAYPNFRLVDYDSISDCFDAVRAGQADLMIQNQYVVEYWISKPAYEKLKVIPVLGMVDELCFSAIVAFDNNGGVDEGEGRTLIDILNKAIASMSEDEVGSYTIQAIMENQYAYDLSDILYRYRYSFIILTISVPIIIALIVVLLRLHLRTLAAQSDARVRAQFLSAMSHEIRTPLNGLIGLNYLIGQRLDDRGRLEKYLHQSTSTARYLLRLINDMLDMSSLQKQELELVTAPLDLTQTLSTVEALVDGAMRGKQLDLCTEIDLPCPAILGDEVRIQQVLLNLLDNARKFTPAGGRVTLRVGQEQTAEGLVLTRMEVADTGRGISESFQPLVFRSFTQERESVSKGNEGAGLGLSISRSLARLMGGDITFTSSRDAGSDFLFTFLARPAPAAAPAQERLPSAPSTAPTRARCASSPAPPTPSPASGSTPWPAAWTTLCPNRWTSPCCWRSSPVTPPPERPQPLNAKKRSLSEDVRKAPFSVVFFVFCFYGFRPFCARTVNVSCHSVCVPSPTVIFTVTSSTAFVNCSSLSFSPA